MECINCGSRQMGYHPHKYLKTKRCIQCADCCRWDAYWTAVAIREPARKLPPLSGGWWLAATRTTR